jgi:hypothetical protein
MNEKITEILEGFRNFDGVYKRELVDAAIELKDEITPYLIEILENLIADPNKYLENSDLWDHIYAVMLLGHFREPKAHKIIIELFSLPGKIADDIFGEVLTEDLPVILLRTCNGSLEDIKSLALNKEADDFCRTSALHAMAYAVVEGIVAREEVLSFFESLFTGREADEHSDFWGLLACLVYELYPEELMETINGAFEDGLINPLIVAYTDFEQALERGKERCLERLKDDFERRSLDDLHKSMSWWACFDANDRNLLSSDIALPVPAVPFGKDSKKKKKGNKKKRKMAKASKRKNRR